MSTGLRWVRLLAASAALLGTPAGARPPVLGVSLGMAFPSDRLSGLPDERGAVLRPAPALGARVSRSRAIAGVGLDWSGSAEVASFRSVDRAEVSVLFVPMQAGVAWEAGGARDVTMRLSVAGGPGFVSASAGAERSLLLGVATVGWQARRAMHDLTVGLDVGLSLLWNDGIRDLFQVKLVLLTE
ncbi:MAG: hypothetical protein AAB368_04275 [bacterium]